jgi:predicted DNA-binding protein with PD1-like motif
MMKSKLLHESAGQRTFALIFDTGDEVMQTLAKFATDNQLTGSHFTAIGAFSEATIAYFDWEKKDYKSIPVREQVEVLMLSGDVAEEDGNRKVHAHVVLGKSTGETRGGHLQSAQVRPTLELILTESPAHLKKSFDPATGLSLIDL